MDKLTPPKLKLHPTHRSEILSWVQHNAPLEACGIVGGDTQSSRKVFPIHNTLKSTTAYLMDAAEMLNAFMEIEDNQWEVLAFFHSHPHSWPSPSKTDLDQNYYPDIPYLIVGIIDEKWELRAYMLKDNLSREIPIVTTQIPL